MPALFSSTENDGSMPVVVKTALAALALVALPCAAGAQAFPSIPTMPKVPDLNPPLTSVPSAPATQKPKAARATAVCTMEYAPVCGWVKGGDKTFSNRCRALNAEATHIRTGPCGQSAAR